LIGPYLLIVRSDYWNLIIYQEKKKTKQNFEVT
jgi:hypothetical protein